jgi:hypothetical protein
MMTTGNDSTGTNDRRRYPRLNAPLYARPARLRKLGEQQEQQVLDASLGGVRIYSDEKYTENDPLELDLFLRDGTSVQCMARVAWTKDLRKLASKPVARFEVGLAFIDVQPDALELLKTVLAKDDGDLDKQ